MCGRGPIGLLGVGVAKALGTEPVILTGTRAERLALGRKLGADFLVNVREVNPVDAVLRLTEGRGGDLALECSGAPDTLDQCRRMVKRVGKICLAAFLHDKVLVDVAHIVRNNVYVYGIRGEGQSATHRAMALMRQRRFEASLIHTHTFPMRELPKAIRHARERIDGAIKVVVTNRS
ncbi:MAG: zinc-binding dehydrogenase [Rhodospirillales bacterium]|nr:zinc-binding dehydrogenase [Rhodospirillales bacterium]